MECIVLEEVRYTLISCMYSGAGRCGAVLYLICGHALKLQNLYFIGHVCSALQLQCGDEFDLCYPRSYRCDGIQHCRNGADESNCKDT